ncbi:MAG: ParB N-terminal domain-containing protein [Acetobacteraceae bacterium]
MTELRSVDPRSLMPNPHNPRRTNAPPAMDEQLVASIRAIGIIQPPVIRAVGDDLVIKAGHRRVQAAIAAEMPVIDVLVSRSGEAADGMEALSENLIRASMNSVDIWRATEALEQQGWNEQAIADALALPVRTVRRLKLLAHLHPPMLDVMAQGSMPNEDQLRTIAAASREEQAQAWKKHRPKKGQDFYWSELARALSKRRIPASAAKFDDEMARAYGVTWHDDLFAPAGEDGRHTSDVDAFFAAQQQWLADNLPAGGALLPVSEYGHPELPKKAQHVYGNPAKGDVTGYYLDERSGEVKTIVYRLPAKEKPAKSGKKSTHATTEDESPAPKAQRPEVTQKGQAMIGDLRTDALHQALREAEIDVTTLTALLVLAFAGRNVSVQSGAALGKSDREQIAETLTEGGTLTHDTGTIQAAARAMLAAVLSCRDNMTDSGPVARIAGDSIGAGLLLPNMATEDFLSCLSKAGVEKAAAAEGVRIGARAKDTRVAMVERFAHGVYVYPGALFRLSEQEIAEAKRRAPYRYVPGSEDVGGEDDGAEASLNETGEGGPEESRQDDEGTVGNEATMQIAAE